MNTFKNKSYTTNNNYISRYEKIPVYLDTLTNKTVRGITKNIKKDIDYIIHTVVQGDNLDALALTYYNNPTYWWAIANFNDIEDALLQDLTKYKTLKIPSISSIDFVDFR